MSQTSSKQKIINYLIEISIKKVFQDKVKKIRDVCHIPEGGFPNEEAKHKWQLNTRKEVQPIFSREVGELTEMYDLRMVKLDHPLMDYIFFNSFKDWSNYDFSLIQLRDIPQHKTECEEFSLQKKLRDEEDEFFPVAIMLNPYTTRQDIKKFLDENFTNTIKPMLKRHQQDNIRLGVAQGKPCFERNNFIYENSHLPYKEIRDKLKKERGEFIDVDNIGKIISEQKKARK